MKRVLVTGSAGLIGSALTPRLEEAGFEVRGFDVAHSVDDNVRDAAALLRAAEGCSGIVHLAAVSRVIWGEKQPAECWATNVGGTKNVLAVAVKLGAWVVSASSREVYGQADVLPVPEEDAVRPCNAYGFAKVAGEMLVREASRYRGVRACTVRFSNVFGSAADYRDRVVPAFARGALRGEDLRVDGADHLFDFTFAPEVARGVTKLVRCLDGGAPPPPPIHFVTGIGTTLGELAREVVQLAGTRSQIREAPPRSYDVARFRGDPARAASLLGWRQAVSLREGLLHLFEDIRTKG